jgi:pullulanase
MDVVYNHTMRNDIMNNIFPDYYYRTDSKIKPVNEVAIASERNMARKIIVDSLLYFAKEFKIDGFRFDLLTFTDIKSIKELTKKLRKVNPNIILHGEAWR